MCLTRWIRELRFIDFWSVALTQAPRGLGDKTKQTPVARTPLSSPSVPRVSAFGGLARQNDHGDEIGFFWDGRHAIVLAGGACGRAGARRALAPGQNTENNPMQSSLAVAGIAIP